MAYSIAISGSDQVKRALEKLIVNSDRALREALYPTLKDWAEEFRGAYRQKRIKFLHRAMKVRSRKRDLRIVIPGGHLFEYGTRRHVVERKHCQVLLGRPQDRTAGARTWRRRPVFGRRAEVAGMKARPVIGEILPGMIARLPGDVAPELLDRLQSVVSF